MINKFGIANPGIDEAGLQIPLSSGIDKYSGHKSYPTDFASDSPVVLI